MDRVHTDANVSGGLFLGLVSCIYQFYKDSIAWSRHLALFPGGRKVLTETKTMKMKFA